MLLESWSTTFCRHDFTECVGRVTGGLLALVGVLGVVIGSVITVAAWRVPRAIGLRAWTSEDGTEHSGLLADVPVLHPSSWGTRARRSPNGVAAPFPLLELITALLFIMMVLLFGTSLTLPAFLLLAAASVLLGVIDLQHHRLPNMIVGPFAAAAVLLLALGAAGQEAWQPLMRALVGGVALFLVYLVLALISPSSLGMGDVKLAGVLGLYLAYLSWRTLILGAAGGFVIAALIGIILLATRRANRRTQVPFGPSMIAAALTAVAFGAGALAS